MKKPVKLLIVFLLAGTVLAVSWIGSKKISNARANSYNPLIMRSFWSAPMPHYPGAKEFPLSNKMTMGNTRVKMSWFRTTDEPLQVAQFYGTIWKKRGHYVTEDVQPFGGRVSSVDVKDNLQRQVIMEKKEKTTIVFVSLIMGRLMHLSNVDTKAANPIMPIYPGAEGVISFGSDDRLADSKTISYVDRGAVIDNVAFYKKEMSSRGYKFASKEHAKMENLPEVVMGTMKMLIFTRDREEVTISISPISGSKRTRVHITKIHGKGE